MSGLLDLTPKLSSELSCDVAHIAVHLNDNLSSHHSAWIYYYILVDVVLFSFHFSTSCGLYVNKTRCSKYQTRVVLLFSRLA